MEAGKLPPSEPLHPRTRRTADANWFMFSLSVAVVCWLLIGSISYGPAARSTVGDGFAAISMPLVFCQLIMLPIALGAADGLWPGRFAALSTAATVGLGAALAYAIFTAGDWAHWGQGLFWSLAGAYGGIAFEAATGFWSWTRERLERTGRGRAHTGCVRG